MASSPIAAASSFNVSNAPGADETKLEISVSVYAFALTNAAFALVVASDAAVLTASD